MAAGRYLPCVAHLCIHVVLPSGTWCTVIVHSGTIAHSLHMLLKPALFLLRFSLPCWHPRCLLLDVSRLLGPALRLSRSCLMPPGNLCHAGGRHMRRKPCVELLYVPFYPVSATCTQTASEEFSSRDTLFGFDIIWPHRLVSHFTFCVHFGRQEPFSCTDPKNLSNHSCN